MPIPVRSVFRHGSLPLLHRRLDSRPEDFDGFMVELNPGDFEFPFQVDVVRDRRHGSLAEILADRAIVRGHPIEGTSTTLRTHRGFDSGKPSYRTGGHNPPAQ